MALFGKLRVRLGRLRADQRGMAVPTALGALLASFGLASAAVISTVNVQHGTHRDQDSKSAIAAADAGASLALLRLNRFRDELTSGSGKCVTAAGVVGGEDSKEPGWCPEEQAETLGGATFSYRISAYEPGEDLLVVATGSDGVVTRRVSVGLNLMDGKNVFADEQLIGQDGVQIKGTSANIQTDIGTNGNVERSGHPTVCGNIRHGNGKSGFKPDCGKEELEGDKELPQISPPADIATNNSNCRLSATCPSKTEVDTFSKKGSPWNSTTGTLDIPPNTSLTMSGGNYYMCKLSLKGSLIMAATAQIQIFIRKPSECNMASGATQFDMGAQGVIEATDAHAAPHIYLLGNGSVTLHGGPGTEQEVLLYAPESSVELKGNPKWTGMIAAKTIVINGNATFESDPDLTPPEIYLRGLWQQTDYVECTGAAVADPGENC
jgi:hypothetical protein